jgi:outer membrane phospholipase A
VVSIGKVVLHEKYGEDTRNVCICARAHTHTHTHTHTQLKYQVLTEEKMNEISALLQHSQIPFAENQGFRFQVYSISNKNFQHANANFLQRHQ